MDLLLLAKVVRMEADSDRPVKSLWRTSSPTIYDKILTPGAAPARAGSPNANDDHGSLYEYLQNQNVEFYVTDPDYFEVRAFEGGHLTQQHFEIGDNNIEVEDDRGRDIDFSGDTQIENYE
jgi:hypothetical protein